MARFVEIDEGKIGISTGEVLGLRSTNHLRSGMRVGRFAELTRAANRENTGRTLKIAMRETGGDQRHVKLRNALQLGLRSGNTLSVAWFIPKGSKRGPYVAALNHDTYERRFYHPPLISRSETISLAIAFIIGSALLFFYGAGLAVQIGRAHV